MHDQSFKSTFVLIFLFFFVFVVVVMGVMRYLSNESNYALRWSNHG
jgi:flagellar basal body-associated protein FliL